MKNNSENHHILIIDDDMAVCTSLKLMLKRAQFQVDTVNYPKDALSFLQTKKPDLILLDMNFSIDTSGTQGLKMIEEIHGIYPKLAVIMLTGWGTLQLAVEGMKKGAGDFMTKPWDNKDLLNSIKTLLQLQNTGPVKPSKSTTFMSFEGIIGSDPEFLNVLEQAKRVSQTDASVLILGESGTGKELLAEAIHYESLRNNESFVKVNLGGISTSLFESEMFGHKKGAFTDASADRRGRFEAADKGSIFLDEIGDLDLSSQVKLLRVLQEKTFEPLGSSESKKIDFRVISATNKDLQKMVGKAKFREDLYYRINLITLTLPPLRDRKADIPKLAQYYVKNLSEIYQKQEIEISSEGLKWLENQNFTGNIRQLKNLVERTLLLSTKKELGPDDFKVNYSPDLQIQNKDSDEYSIPAVGKISIEEMEKEMIIKALDYHNFKVNKAAKSLGITRSALYRRMTKFNISDEAED